MQSDRSSSVTIPNPFTVVNDVKNSTEAADKVCKMTVTAVKIADTVAKVSTNVTSVCEPLSKFAAQLAVFSGVVGAFNWINRFCEWTVPKMVGVGKNRKKDFQWKFYKKQSGKKMKTLSGKPINAQKNVYQDDGYWSGPKTFSQFFLTIAHSIEFVKFLEVIALFSYGAFSSTLALAKSIAYIPASTLGIVAAGLSLRDSSRHVNNVAAKVERWREKMGGDNSEKFEATKWTAHYTAKEKEAEGLKTGASKKQCEILDQKIKKYTLFIREIGSVNSTETGNLKETEFFKYSETKKEKWIEREKIAKGNKKKVNTKTWLTIADNVGKFALGVIGLVGLAVGIATNPWFIIAISAGWFVTYTFGLTKWLYGRYNSPIPITKPVVEIRNLDAEVDLA